MQVQLALSGIVVCLCLAPILSAQDAAKVNPKHYTVMSENEQVRILRVRTVIQTVWRCSSPTAQCTLLSLTERLDSKVKAGDATYTPAVTHLPEDQGEKPFELILIELKGRGGAGGQAGRDNRQSRPCRA